MRANLMKLNEGPRTIPWRQCCTHRWGIGPVFKTSWPVYLMTNYALTFNTTYFVIIQYKWIICNHLLPDTVMSMQDWASQTRKWLNMIRSNLRVREGLGLFKVVELNPGNCVSSVNHLCFVLWDKHPETLKWNLEAVCLTSSPEKCRTDGLENIKINYTLDS